MKTDKIDTMLYVQHKNLGFIKKSPEVAKWHVAQALKVNK
jgi:hypothetical protein